MRQPAARLVVINPENPILGRDRRTSVRHRPQTPAYANLNGSSMSAPLEFCEILDISPSGMCIQASATMKANRLLPLVLDLSQTNTRLHTTGHVVWSDSSGRTGIRFPEMPESTRSEVQRWLVVDASAGAADPAVDPEATALTVAPRSEMTRVINRPMFAPSYSSMMAEWAAIEKEVDFHGPEVEPALQMLAHRALALTWASGAAIALMNKLRPSELICVARAGTDSPELGERIHAGSGFSAECVRAAAALRCDDAQTDPRVDRDSCRALGISSLVACPIKKRSGEVIGILEVFSPEPTAFWDNDSTILERLSRIVANAVTRAEYKRPDLLVFDTPVQEEPSLFAEAIESAETQVVVTQVAKESRNLLLFATGLIAVVLTTWLVAPWIDQAFSKMARSTPGTAQASPVLDSYVTAKFSDLKSMAEGGKREAQYSLAMRYATGDGVLQNYREAVAWFLKAADKGDYRATSKLAACFWAGRGATQDYSKAYFWGLLAQAAGDETGRIIVMNSASHLSPAHIAREQEAAEKWLHDHQITSHSTEE